MYRKKADDKHPDNDQRREALFLKTKVGPVDQLLHAPGSLERRRGLKDNADLITPAVEGSDAVFNGLVFASVPVVLGAHLHEGAVHLLDDVFGERHFFPGFENLVHQHGVACYFLLVPVSEGLSRQSGHDSGDFIVGEPRPFDSGRRADAFDRCNALELGQTSRREIAVSLPAALELFDLEKLGDYFLAEEE